ncbi:MAG: hypothetical protein K0S33_3170 [Bacteroidetes bacterium]|jgi:hypothetical protein|nr:hypothetical protein [Bacteroidota bacterium]
MAAVKKKYPEQKDKLIAAAEASAVYTMLTKKEQELLNAIQAKPTFTSINVLETNNSGLKKILKKITKALTGKQSIDIPSKDYVDQFIDKEKLQITTIVIDKSHDRMLFLLNNGATLQEKISRYPLLNKASEKKLKNYGLYAGNTCVEWTELDEDLSLRGLLKDIVFDPLVKSLRGREGFVLSNG